MEHPPPLPRDEQYPLLKVEGGGGDSNIRAPPPPSVLSSRWNVTCATKRSWCSRWPEFVSACWMTIILVAISFLVFYAVGMNAYRRQPVVIVRCNDSAPASDVYYHHIVSRDAYIPFSLYSGYISYMAKRYPALRFYVYFLIDDSFENQMSSRHLKFIKRLVPQFHETFFMSNQKRVILDFQKQYQNVNISVIYLSQYMAMTPLRYKWRLIPLHYLSFYARIYATWQNGGIGFDLVAFNNQFNSDHELDSRIDVILKQHNTGIETEKYADTFNSLDNMEENKLFSTVFGLINQLFNETFSFFDTDFISNANEKQGKERSHRNKRDVKVENSVKDSKENSSLNNSDNNGTDSETLNVIKEQAERKDLNDTSDIKNSSKFNIKLPKLSNTLDFMFTNASNFLFDLPQVFFFYDSSGLPYNPGPSYYLPKAHGQSNSNSIKNPFLKKPLSRNLRKPNYLSISPEGHFVATSSKHHPFLSQLFSAGCQTMSPKYAIKDTLLTQCAGFLRDDVYCENIRVIYDAI